MLDFTITCQTSHLISNSEFTIEKCELVLLYNETDEHLASYNFLIIANETIKTIFSRLQLEITIAINPD